MSLDEYLPIIIIVLGITLFFFYSRTPAVPNNPDTIPGVTTSTVETIHAAFPDIPLPNLIYSLSKTRSGQATSEEIIEKGFLPAPPPTYQIPSSLQPPTVNPPSAPSSPITSTSGSSSARSNTAASTKGVSLIERYGLTNRVLSRKGKEVEVGEKGAGLSEAAEIGESGTAVGRGKWEDSREGRERGLKERKERMILEARRRMMEKEAKAAEASA